MLENISEPSILITTVAAAVAAILPLVTLFKKNVLIPVKKFLDRIEQLDKISYALTPNGGSSLYDRIVSMDQRISWSDFRTKAVLTHLNIGECKFDMTGQCIYISGTICRILNRTESEFLGNNWLNLINDSERDHIIDNWEQSISTNRNFLMDFNMTHANGELIKISSIIMPISDSIKKPIGWSGTLMIISHQ